VPLDASFTQQHLAGHIPGAVSADLYRCGVPASDLFIRDSTAPVMCRARS